MKYNIYNINIKFIINKIFSWNQWVHSCIYNLMPQVLACVLSIINN